MTTSTAPSTRAKFIVLWEQPNDPAAFEKHYREVHVPLARELPGLRRYTLNWAPAPVRGEEFFMVAELEWDSMAEVQAAFASQCGTDTREDVLVLSGYAASRSFLVAAGEDMI